jgi:transposase
MALGDKNKTTVNVERIDDIPLLVQIVKSIGLGELMDKEITVHKNWRGLSIGKVAEIWLCYVLSEGDHRLNQLEEWVMERKMAFGVLYGEEQISYTDFTDDKLAIILDYMSKNDSWLKIELGVNEKIIGVYKLLDSSDRLPSIRLDATIGKGHRSIEEDGLYQYGASKQFDPSLPQFKVMMSTLDSEINGFAYPVANMIVPGNTADDVLYLPILEQTKKSLGTTESLLVIGDKKIGSQGNRAQIVEGGDYYLCPLSEVQVSAMKLKSIIKEKEAEIRSVKIDKEIIGSGFEYEEEMSVILKAVERESKVEWTERRIVFRSLGHAKTQMEAFDRKTKKVKEELENILVKKQGKKVLKTEEEIKEMASKIISESKLEEYIKVDLLKSKSTKNVRGYKGNEKREEKETLLELNIKLDEKKIEEYKANCGWCIYATNAPKRKMSIEDIVSMYRGQFQIETRFNDLKNKVTKLMPVFLQKENRVRGLINFLMVALKIICAMEIKVAGELKKEKRTLTGVYAGNPKRGTEKPTAKMMLKKFTGISVSILKEGGKPKYIGLTPLDKVQLEILQLLGLNKKIYEELIEKLNFKFLT